MVATPTPKRVPYSFTNKSKSATDLFNNLYKLIYSGTTSTFAGSLILSISRWHSFVIGLRRIVIVVFISPRRRRFARVTTVELGFTLAARTNPSSHANTSTTLPNGHCPREKLLSIIRTRSSIFKLGLVVFHFCRCCKFGKYSSFPKYISHVLCLPPSALAMQVVFIEYSRRENRAWS